jgi:hypothetical protein
MEEGYRFIPNDWTSLVNAQNKKIDRMAKDMN